LNALQPARAQIGELVFHRQQPTPRPAAGGRQPFPPAPWPVRLRASATGASFGSGFATSGWGFAHFGVPVS